MLLMRKALARDHKIIAYVSSPLEINFKHVNLIIVQGDLADLEGITFASKQADAVISAIESTPAYTDDLLFTAAKHILAAMKANDIKRLIWSASTNVRTTQDEPTLKQRLTYTLFKWFSNRAFKAANRATEIIRSSALDWTIARAPRLIDEPRRGTYHVSNVGPEMGPVLTRENYAEFMLHLVESGAWVQDLPVVSDR